MSEVLGSVGLQASPVSPSPSLANEPATPSMDDCINAEICGLARAAARRVTGGNFTFVDMDIQALEMLAYTAVRAGLTDGLSPSVAAKARIACAAHPFATQEGVAIKPAADGEARDGEAAERPTPKTAPQPKDNPQALGEGE